MFIAATEIYEIKLKPNKVSIDSTRKIESTLPEVFPKLTKSFKVKVRKKF